MGEIIISTMKISLLKLSVKLRSLISVIFFSAMALPVNLVQAQETIDVGKTGWDVKRKYDDENERHGGALDARAARNNAIDHGTER